MIVLGDCLAYVGSVCKWQHVRGGISKKSSSLLQRGLSYHTRERSDGRKWLLHILTLTRVPLPALTHRPHSHRIFTHALFNLENKSHSGEIMAVLKTPSPRQQLRRSHDGVK